MMESLSSLSNYQIIEQLGSGASGVAYKAIFLPTQSEVAIKVIPKQSNHEENANIFKEISLLKTIDHPLIIHFFDCFQDHQNFYIVMEYIENGSLLDYINQKHGLPITEVKHFLRQLIEVLDFLHNVCHIVHRDLKPENILIDKNKNLRLIDFGLSRTFANSSSRFRTVCGTCHYTAPEIIQNQEYGPSVDIWSAGIIFYAMMFGKLPFYSENYHEVMKSILTTKPSFPDFFPQEIKSLMKGFLKKDPLKRFSIKQIKEHPFQKGTNDLNELRTLSILKSSDSFYNDFSYFMREKMIEIPSHRKIIDGIIHNDCSVETVSYSILKVQYISNQAKQIISPSIYNNSNAKSNVLRSPQKMVSIHRRKPSSKSLPNTLDISKMIEQNSQKILNKKTPQRRFTIVQPQIKPRRMTIGEAHVLSSTKALSKLTE